jgi:hypothetical protein
MISVSPMTPAQTILYKKCQLEAEDESNPLVILVCNIELQHNDIQRVLVNEQEDISNSVKSS